MAKASCFSGLFNYTLYKSIELDPAEISCSKLLNSEFLRGGLVQITPTDPFEEDKGESRSMVASMIGTPQLSTPTAEAPSGVIGAGKANSCTANNEKPSVLGGITGPGSKARPFLT